MRRSQANFLTIGVIVAAALMFAITGLIGGPDFARDVGTIFRLAGARSANPDLTNQAIIITEVGGAPGMMTILAVSVALLAYARRWRDMASLVVIVISGRMAIELLKLAIHRPRPFFGPYPVEISSLSFPSGHAGNSMITFLALALIAAPAGWRPVAVTAAIGASLAVGATRPLLGVHWPTDVLGGWAFGIGWVVGLVALGHRWRRAPE